MSTETPLDVFTGLIIRMSQNQNFKNRIAKWNKVFQFNPTDGEQFYVEIANGTASVKRGAHEKPEATLIASSQDFVAIFKGQLDGVKAFFTGKLRVQGNVMATQDLAPLFKEAVQG